MDFILIEGLELDCIVGLRPVERRRPQRVRLDLSLGLEVAAAGRSGRIALSCDYDRVTEEVMALLRFREYRLVESATEELAAMLFGIYPALLQAEIRLDKPTALRGRAYSTGVRVTRRREQFPAPTAAAFRRARAPARDGRSGTLPGARGARTAPLRSGGLRTAPDRLGDGGGARVRHADAAPDAPDRAARAWPQRGGEPRRSGRGTVLLHQPTVAGPVTARIRGQ